MVPQSYVIDIIGEKVSETEALQREKAYKMNEMGCYIYYNIVGKEGKFW